MDTPTDPNHVLWSRFKGFLPKFLSLLEIQTAFPPRCPVLYRLEGHLDKWIPGIVMGITTPRTLNGSGGWTLLILQIHKHPIDGFSVVSEYPIKPINILLETSCLSFATEDDDIAVKYWHKEDELNEKNKWVYPSQIPNQQDPNPLLVVGSDKTIILDNSNLKNFYIIKT